MTELDPILAEKRPDLLMVVGDVNSTLAGTLVAVKLHIPVAHVEAGLRSGDRRMPEEINRIVTDALSDMLLTSCMDGNRNLEDEGVPKERIHFVGNIMIDSLVGMLERSRKSAILDELGLETKKYICITLHRPSNVDTPETLRSVLDALDDAARDMPVIFPVHPRTRKNIAALDWTPKHDNFRLEEPLGYIDFLRLMSESSLVITDSGGIQEETSFLGIPCLTVRENTERPITITEGTNRLVDSDRDTLSSAIREALSRAGEPKPQIKYWDGHTAERIVDVLQSRQISFAGTP
jgi:UDP-N-acetylglucosamine 2-epimerase (non-hydrolysing)